MKNEKEINFTDLGEEVLTAVSGGTDNNTDGILCADPETDDTPTGSMKKKSNKNKKLRLPTSY